jgi:hypothetical protein
MSRKALLIGINYCGTSSELRGCINDILNIRHLLITEFQLEEKNIIMLSEAAGSSSLLPTKTNILNHIQWLVADAKPDSKLFFHYSGHGSHVPDRNKDENDGQDETLCPLDYATNGLILDDLLKQVLIDPLPKGCNLFALIDACHSGTALDLRVNYLFHNTKNKEQYSIEIENRATESNGNVILCSAALDTQYAADSFLSGKNQGAFTYAFIKSFADIKAIGMKMSIFNLMKTITQNLKYRKFEQDAKLSSSHLIDLTTPLTII